MSAIYYTKAASPIQSAIHLPSPSPVIVRAITSVQMPEILYVLLSHLGTIYISPTSLLTHPSDISVSGRKRCQTTKPSSDAVSRSNLSRPVANAPYTLSGTATSKLSQERFSTATRTSPPRSSRDISSRRG